jgi:hypothetical protein
MLLTAPALSFQHAGTDKKGAQTIMLPKSAEAQRAEKRIEVKAS